ncbi:AaceriADL050Wp [[Ashbya] aceris (nom. inval.)]|nr:AaceriADL050Wp [[Ashbya] aceris (nom. inval.)]
MLPALHSEEPRKTFTGPVQSYPWTRLEGREKTSGPRDDTADELAQASKSDCDAPADSGPLTDSPPTLSSPFMALPSKTCPVCLKEFTRKTSLNTHLLIHADIRPYRCEYANCNKTFNVKSNLNRHLRIHRKQELRHEQGSPQEPCDP